MRAWHKSRLQLVLWLLCGVILAHMLAQSYLVFATRRAFSEHDALMRRHSENRAELLRLRTHRAALRAPQRLESHAITRLDMVVPQLMPHDRTAPVGGR